MPGSTVLINSGKGGKFYVDDSKMEALLKHLRENGQEDPKEYKKPELKLTREFLRDLREVAARRGAECDHPGWHRAYNRLADAADTLEAMDARCTLAASELEEIPTGKGQTKTAPSES